VVVAPVPVPTTTPVLAPVPVPTTTPALVPAPPPIAPAVLAVNATAATMETKPRDRVWLELGMASSNSFSISLLANVTGLSLRPTINGNHFLRCGTLFNDVTLNTERGVHGRRVA
jgi:hypothetical protein